MISFLPKIISPAIRFGRKTGTIPSVPKLTAEESAILRRQMQSITSGTYETVKKADL